MRISLTHMLHGAGIFTYIYPKNCPGIPYMEHVGLDGNLNILPQGEGGSSGGGGCMAGRLAHWSLVMVRNFHW